MSEQKTKWLDCGNGTLAHPATGAPVQTDVVELEGFGRIFEVYHYGNEPEQAQRLILGAPEMLETLKAALERLNCANLSRKPKQGHFMTSDIEQLIQRLS